MATNLSNWQNFLNRGTDASNVGSASVQQQPQNIKNVDDIWEEALRFKLNRDPLDIRGVVEKIFKLKLQEQDLKKDASGFLEQINDTWCIIVNKYESETRKRFTIAHELGHYVCHRNEYNSINQYDQIFFRDENTNPMEQEANDFAAKLLMPEHIFYKYIREGHNTINLLAEKFNLSTSAVKYRAYKLGLISEYA